MGIIPAYAGNTSHSALSCSVKSGSSPHTRGTLVEDDVLDVGEGDHPRIRGEHADGPRGCGCVVGIIPAYAGNTAAQPGVGHGVAGSSPHTRGTPQPTFIRRSLQRIIPAYAGNTTDVSIETTTTGGSSPHTRGTLRQLFKLRANSRDHPRIRGEHSRFRRWRAARTGIIPAYAGNTDMWTTYINDMQGSSPHTRGTPGRSRRSRSPWWDHPRIRREHVSGLSKLVKAIGIIPAYAGNTFACVFAFAALAGSSPHTRGTLYADTDYIYLQGDHPRIRGEHAAVAARWHARRGIIPAYAGNTAAPTDEATGKEGSSPHTRGTPQPWR